MSIAQTIYTRLRAAGLTEAAALGMLGNWQCESPGLLAYQVEGDFSPYRTVSKDYTARVERGAISRDQFAKDAKGYGLAQWTYFSRKYNLYDFWKKSGEALDDPYMQTRFALWELATAEYSALFSLLKSNDDLYTCTKLICEQYERPAVNNIDSRFRAAKEIKEQLQLDAPTGTVDVPTGWEKIPATEFWPPRTICNGMKGPDVEVLQAVLKARGWIVTNPDGVFGSYLTEKVKAFQETAFPDNQSEWDGIVGPKTWEKLLNIGG